MSARSDIERRAGRGGIAVLSAKVYFILAGLLQQVLLPRVIGLAGYGALSRVLAVANVVNNVIVTSGTQGVSRAVAGARGDDRGALRRLLSIHAPIALVAMIGFAIAAPIVSRLELAGHILWPLVVMSAVVGLYGVYAPLVGALNGRGQFTTQAALDVTFATLRTIGLVLGGLILASRGLGVLGAVLGFAAAALAIVPLALRAAGSGTPGRETELRTKPYLTGLWPLAIAQLATNLVMQSDISILGRFLSAGAPDMKTADEWVGVYRACQLFALLPYQLLMSVTQVLFPMLARAKADGDGTTVKRLTLRGARLATIAGGGVVCVVTTLPATLLRFAYDMNVASRGENALRILALGQGMFALLGVATTVLASLGQERRAARVTLAALALSAGACVLFVSRAPFGAAQLEASAACVTAAMAIALLLASLAVRRAAGAFTPLATALRVAAVLGLGCAAGTRIPTLGRPLAPVASLGVVGAYFLLLFVTGELRTADVADFVRLIRKR